MKIVIISGHWQGGGAESIARELFNYLTKQHECYFLYMSGKAIENEKVIKCGLETEHYAHAAYARIFDTDGCGSPISTLRLIRCIESIKPDIVNIHNIVCYSVNYSILFEYLWEKNISVIWTLHDCWAFTGHCISIDEKKCNKWESGCGGCPALDSYPKSILFDKSKSNLEKKKKVISKLSNLCLVTPSKWLSEVVSKTYLNKYSCYVINNGIDLKVFKPIQSKLREKYLLENKVVLLCVASRWTKSKGLSFINELCEILDFNKYALIVIGNTTKDNNELNNKIIHIERTSDREELAEWYTLADVFLNPTLADNFPTVNLEAMACGTPVVTFDTGGSWESVGANCGVLANNKNAKSLQNAIERCIEKNITTEQCINRAKMYSKNTKFMEYEKLCQMILNAKNNKKEEKDD